jgi:hypothetical protein
VHTWQLPSQAPALLALQPGIAAGLNVRPPCTFQHAVLFFSCSLPAAWRLPPAIQEVHLQGNKISGVVPPSMELPTTLKVLDLSENSLSGELEGTAQCLVVSLNTMPERDLNTQACR